MEAPETQDQWTRLSLPIVSIDQPRLPEQLQQSQVVQPGLQRVQQGTRWPGALVPMQMRGVCVFPRIFTGSGGPRGTSRTLTPH